MQAPFSPVQNHYRNVYRENKKKKAEKKLAGFANRFENI